MLGGTVGTIHLGHEATRGFDPVATAVEECYGTTRYFERRRKVFCTLVGHPVWHSMVGLITYKLLTLSAET